MQENEVKSPCIGVCVLDIEDVCEGCFRTAAEVGDWTSFNAEQQRQVVELSWQRARDSGKVL